MAQKNFIKRIISNPLIQTFLIYVSGGWIALEITDYIINNYGISDKVRDVLSILLLIGLPITIFLAWYLNKGIGKGVVTNNEELKQRSFSIQSDQRHGTYYQIKRSRIIISGILVLSAIAISVVFQQIHQSRVRWAKNIAKGHDSWKAFDLVNEVKKNIPDDPLLNRLEQRISWNVKFYTDPAGSKVYVKPYNKNNAKWRFIGETPTDSIRLPRELSIVRIEKEGFRTLYDVVWNHWSAGRDSLYYLLPAEGSIPNEMELISQTPINLNSTIQSIHGLEHIRNELTGDFLMDKYEVTNAEYKRFVDSGGYENSDYWKYPIVKDGRILDWEEAKALFIDRTGITGPATWQVGDYPDGEDDYPVSGVSWYEAAAYAEFSGKSLPTIYHWIYTANVETSSYIIPLSNFNNNYPLQVGHSGSMNRCGIYDLAGNVREWCFNPATPGTNKIIMGGGWNDPGYAFNAFFAQQSIDRSDINGFRCIKYIGTDISRSNLEKAISYPIRDSINLKEAYVSDDIFDIYLNQYSYDKLDLNSIIETEEEEDDFIKQKISFNAPYGNERMMAYLFLPKQSTPPYQTVIYFPGSGSINRRSSNQLNISDMFVKSGRAVIFPIYKGTYERGDGLSSCRPDETNFYKEHVIMWVKDLSRSIDYLETRNDIDANKLAFYGLSWGGALGAIIPAVEQRIITSILVVAGIFFEQCFPEVDQRNYLPHITTSVLMLNGKYDFFFPYEKSQIPFYELLGTPIEHKKLIPYEQGHSVPRLQVVKETLSWLDRYLGPVNN
jgi:dienelactone hydrolase